jgi:uncharacterized protein
VLCQTYIEPINNLYKLSDSFYFCDDRICLIKNKVDTSYSTEGKDSVVIYATNENGKRITENGFYLTGEKYCENHYNWDKKIGNKDYWYRNGKKMMESYFNICYNNTTFISWYENGNIESVSYYDSKTKSGFSKYWYQNGILKDETFHLDTLDGGYLEKVHYESGELKNENIVTLHKGKQYFKEFYKNGQVKTLCYYRDIVGQWVGKLLEWHENGVLKREFYFNEYIPNQPEGIWKWWDENGNLIKEEKYKNGELIKSKEYVNIKDNNN